MRSSWTGTVSIALLTLPVALGPATGDNELKLNQVRRSDGSQIKYKRVAEADGKEVEYRDIAKGYKAPDGRTVILENEDFERAFGEKTREAGILMFTSTSTIPRLATSKNYLVKPGKGGDKTYALLHKALVKTGKVAIVSFAVGQRQHLASIYPGSDGYLILEQLMWHEDVRKPDFDAPTVDVSDAELDMACKLVESLSKDFDHAEHKDESTAKLQEIIQDKLEHGNTQGKQTVTAPEKSGEQAATDLMAVLQASVADIKQNRKKAS
jgi:DNA end-binding protein Ku